MDRARPAYLSLLVLALPLIALAASGCTKQACFQWTELEGACPSQDEALAFFENPGCPSAVRSIDGPAEFDGELCCYDVTTASTGDDLCEAPPNPGGGGVGGASPGTSVGSGPAPDPACARCPDLVFGGMGGVCSEETIFLADELMSCMCGGPCAESCGDNFCQGFGELTDACSVCVQDFENGCGDQFNRCLGDSGKP